VSILKGNPPVLIGPVPLFAVQSIVLTDGYKIERVMGGRFLQALTPSEKSIQIEALLFGPNRLLIKKALEGLALATRWSASPVACDLETVPAERSTCC